MPPLLCRPCAIQTREQGEQPCSGGRRRLQVPQQAGKKQGAGVESPHPLGSSPEPSPLLCHCSHSHSLLVTRVPCSRRLCTCKWHTRPVPKAVPNGLHCTGCLCCCNWHYSSIVTFSNTTVEVEDLLVPFYNSVTCRGDGCLQSSVCLFLLLSLSLS